MHTTHAAALHACNLPWPCPLRSAYASSQPSYASLYVSAPVGGEEVRKLLTAVSKLPPAGPPPIAEPRAPKQRPGANDPTPQDLGLPGLFE